jgi:hypothetical protein
VRRHRFGRCPAAAGVGDAITSGQCASTSLWALPEYRTIPEVAATAAPVHNTAAPGYVDEPASTPVTPWVYLSSCGPGTGQRAATSAASKPRTSVLGKSRPMSISFTRPQSASACTGLRPPKVTVNAACTAGPVIAPVATSMPLGMSTATTGIAASSAAANTSAASGRSGPDPEMPTTPSTTRSVVVATLSTIRPPALRKAARAFRWVCSGLSSTASAAAPRRRRKVVAHSASPPLSPEPTTAHTRRPATPPVRAVNSPAIATANP